MRGPHLAALTALVALAVPAGASAASCGAVNSGFENTIRTTNLSCSKGRSIARRWHDKALAKGPYGTKYVGSFRCTSQPLDDQEHVKVRCAYNSHKVTFFAGP
jgi:hypothetical protein